MRSFERVKIDPERLIRHGGVGVVTLTSTDRCP
jgi:hypothetical protein